MIQIRDHKIGIVIPWFGRELSGGAEQQAWQIAARLTQRGYAVEVLTTACGSFHEDWSVNRHAPGVTNEPEGFDVRRFPVEPRNRPEFDRVCGHLLALDARALKPGVSPISPQDERVFAEHLIRCPALISYLRADGWRYAALIFIPYLYGPILDGLPLVASRALLQPCLHDEAYAYLSCVQTLFFNAKAVLWNSEGEAELGRRLFGPAVAAKSIVVGEGVEKIGDPRGPLGSALAHLKPFILVLGRKDPGKGTLFAAEIFRRYRDRTNSTLNLVFAGSGDLQMRDPERNIHDLGLVSEDQRAWLLRETEALLQPSPNESFSRVLFEAWRCGRPAMVRSSCPATARAVEACQGGWTAETFEEWAEVFRQVESLTRDELDEIGHRGGVYANVIADWENVMDRYEDALSEIAGDSSSVIRVSCALTADAAQTVRVVAGDFELGAWSLAPGVVQETGWLQHRVRGHEPVIRFESDRPAAATLPNSRRLGFRLERFDAQNAHLQEASLRYLRGWHRSESGPGRRGPRWSTGSAEIALGLGDTDVEPLAVHQVLPNLGYADAIGNHAIWIRDQLQRLGYNSEIFARHIAPEMLHEAHHLENPDTLCADAAILYHHSIGTEITPWICSHPGPKALIYHNITPARFFEPYRPEFAEFLRHGRKQLSDLAPHFAVSVGVSTFNASELASAGFENPGVLPLCIDPSHWNHAPDEAIMKELQDGRTNILFVGRIVPNKRHEDLIYTFKFWLEDDPLARLILVGTAEVSSFYLECLQELARKLRVDHAVHFVGRVNEAQLHAYYRCASMFWCMSEHEGFCVPLIEACAFGVPIVARAEGAVEETLGSVGVLLRERGNPSQLPRLIAETRAGFDREALWERVGNYGPENVSRTLRELVQRLINANVAVA